MRVLDARRYRAIKTAVWTKLNDALTGERNRLREAKERKLSDDADSAKSQQTGDLKPTITPD